MKKLIILSILTIMSIDTYAIQDSVKQDFKTVVYKDVKDVIKSLAETLKVGTEHVYGVLVKQSVVDSIVWLILGIMSAILLYFSVRIIKSLTWENDSEGAEIPLFVLSLLIGGVGLCLLIGTTLNIDTIVTGFVNPEYLAIEKIVSMLK